MKKVYIILSHTGTLLSRAIKQYTKDEFSHVSISLDINLKEMYSMGRLNPYNPIFAGFVHERINKGTYKRFFNTVSSVCFLNVTDEQFEEIKENIRIIEKNRYRFNFLGLLGVGLHTRIKQENAFYCAEFVKYILENSGVKTYLPELVKPEDFKELIGTNEIYHGYLRNYNVENIDVMQFLNKSLAVLG